MRYVPAVRSAACVFGVRLACALGAAVGVGTAAAQQMEAATRRSVEEPIQLDSIRNWHVTSLGRVLEDSTRYGARACNQVASHTDANFGGGTFVAQAGFGEGESFGATYTLPASAFPIRINLAEAIFVTSGATMATTTQWAVSFWAGTPSTGSLVFSESSDDVILPHIRMPQGTNGVNVQFSVDTMDPEQIDINDNGSHQFSIAWRINRHHQQTQNPCLVSPPTCCNAFPATDVSGLQQPANNWLFGLNCGPFGCPANGGWARFSQLPSFCRPSGDVVTRVTWSTIATCQPGVGACCFPDGHCEQTSADGCAQVGGTWRGEFTDCAGANCPAPMGACCFSNGFCTPLTPAQCQGAQGTYLGNDVACGAGSQCPTGACCLPSGSCAPGITQSACAGQGGAFGGVGSTCAAACPIGACCAPTGSCSAATQIQCTTAGGTWQGANTTCGGVNCPQPTGACCTNNGFCFVAEQATCNGIPGAVWAGALTTCADGNGNGQADICESDRCIGDYNEDGGIDGADVEAFYVEWAEGNSNADVNEDGGVDGGDVETFYLEWESGSC